MASELTYPVKVEAQLDTGLSRWLWLVKWLLVIPHYFVLTFLWMAFVLLSVLAFFSILFTGRYPRAIFNFNVGVLRWSWRVSYYSYGALATDRYPPFSLEDVADYPVHLDVEYPERLSRGLVLVKWWLLAIPHYLIVGLFLGGAWVAARGDEWALMGFGLIGLLTLVAGIVLTFTGAYPGGIFDLLLGLNRWVIRVAAYAGLMTDAYPPFRLDSGGHEPGGSGVVTEPQVVSPASAASDTARRGWTVGPIIALVLGSLLGLTSLGLLTGGGLALWVDRTQREGGFVTSPTVAFQTESYAVVSDAIDIRAEGPDWVLPKAILGDARVRVTGGEDPIFVGVARTRDIERYLRGVSYAVVPDLIRYDEDETLIGSTGGSPANDPTAQDFWVVSEHGTGTQTITWPVETGSWSLLVMNADASRGLTFEGDVGAEAPALDAIAIGLLIGGGVFLLFAIVLIAGGVAKAGRSRTRDHELPEA